MPRGVANTIQITFMELKVPRPKLEDVGNAKAVTVKIAENVPHVKINQNLEVSNCTQLYLGMSKVQIYIVKKVLEPVYYVECQKKYLTSDWFME